MVHLKVTLNWVFEHFLAYLCLSIADSDCIITDKELEQIRAEAFKNLDPERVRSLIKEVKIEFLSHSDEEIRSFISENSPKYLRTDAIRKKTIIHLENLVNKDTESNEYLMFRYIRRVINNQ